MGKISDLVNKNLLKKVQKASTFKSIAKESADMVRVRVRGGRGVKKDRGSEYTFAELEPSTIAARKKKKLLSGEAASTSNLTETGQLTKSITGVAKSGYIEIYLKGERNQDLAIHHEKGVKSKKGLKKRPFMHLSKAEYKKIYNLIRAKINSIVKGF